MSFILDALRRADRERKAGSNPDLQRVVELSLAAPTRRRWTLAALGVLLLCGAVAVALLWPRQDPPVMASTEIEASPSPAAETATPAELPSAPTEDVAPRNEVSRPLPPPSRPTAQPTVQRPTRAPASVQGAAPPATRRQPGPARQRAPARRQPPAATARPAPRVAPQEPELNPTLQETAATTTPAAPAEVPSWQADQTTEAVTETNPQPGAPSPATSRTPTQKGGTPSIADEAGKPPMAASSAPTTAPLLADLPAAERNVFADVRLDAHVYSDDPADRFVLIGMRGYRVGDSVGADGPVVEAITVDGAILRAGTLRALVPHP